MKTYFHYIWYVIKSHYKKDPFDIIMPIWIAVSLTLTLGGCVMLMLNASPGNFGALWWFVLIIAGVISSPFVIAPITNWIEARQKNYTAWKNNSSNSDKKSQENP